MTWTEIPPADIGAKKGSEPVTASLTPKAGRYRQRFVVVARPDLFDGGLPWWGVGEGVTVQIGTGAHDGMLRVTPGGPHRLRRPGGNPTRKMTAAMLVLHELPGLAPDAHRPAPVEFDHGDDWLEITIPAWARATKPAEGAKPAAATPAPSPARAAPAPHVSIMERVPDPAAKLGRATGGPVPEFDRAGRNGRGAPR